MTRTTPRAKTWLAAAAAAGLVLWPVAAGAVNDPGHADQWALDVIGADQARAVGQADGIVIAIVDTGVDLAHEDLAGRLVAGRDFVDDDDDPQDEYGHGTHVAGIAAAATDNGRGIAGVAGGAQIMPVRVLGDDGSGNTTDVSNGIRWAVDQGAHVVNLSLGRQAQQVFGPGFVDAVRYAWDSGAVVVVAAGNDFVLSSGFADEPALVVSATTRDDRKPDYSSGVGSAAWGMAAPGGGCQLVTCPQEDDVLSTYWLSGKSNTYAYLSGTSMAAPHVAGAAAILRGLGLTPQQTVDRLLATAKDIGASGRDNTFGAGRLDLAAAVAGLGGTTTQSPSPPPSPPPSPSPAPPVGTSSPSPGPTGGAAPSPASTTSPSPSPQPTAPAAGDGSAQPSGSATPWPSAADDPAVSPQPSEALASNAAAPPPTVSPDDGGSTGPLVLIGVVVAGLLGVGAARLLSRRRT